MMADFMENISILEVLLPTMRNYLAKSEPNTIIKHSSGTKRTLVLDTTVQSPTRIRTHAPGVEGS